MIGSLGSIAAIAALFVGPSDLRPLVARALSWSRSEMGEFVGGMLALIVLGAILGAIRPRIERVWFDDNERPETSGASIGQELLAERSIGALLGGMLIRTTVGWG
ncbi:MAG TPA: hypothetical protein VNV25_02245 [Gemmatimonadaceae bacterium]|nr:hypothetical protein [Gemmatimonadaceae bacterium]